MQASISHFRLTRPAKVWALVGLLFLSFACTDGIPSTPGGLTARPGDAQVALSWLPVPQIDVKLYNIYWGSSPDQQDETQSVVSPTTKVTLYGLQNGTVYYFAVDAENEAGQRGGKSALVSATPMAPQATSAPSLKSTTPPDSQINVSLTTLIRIEFTESMDPTTVQVSSEPAVDLGAPVWTANNTIVTFPHAPSLVSNTYYQFTVQGKGSNGLGLIAPTTFNFTTANVDTTPPYVVDTSPRDDTPGVDPSSTIYVVFSEAMNQQFDPVLVSITPDFPWDQGWYYDGGGKTLGIVPTRQLDFGTTYTVTIGTSAQDLAGNHLAQPYVFRFSTPNFYYPYSNP